MRVRGGKARTWFSLESFRVDDLVFRVQPSAFRPFGVLLAQATQV